MGKTEVTGREGALAAILEERPSWANNLILAGIRGSDAHGTKLPPYHPMATDDTDTFGVSVQTTDWYLGLGGYHNSGRQHWDTAGDDYDHLIYDVRNLFGLLSKGNPNVQGWLWSEPEDHLLVTGPGRLILENRKLFLSRACIKALTGYAYAQMKKMDKSQYQGYMGEKRKRIVDKMGYDVKHAAHCVRLLQMGIELMETGEMRTRRPADEAETLKDIKAGEWGFRDAEALIQVLWDRSREREGDLDLPDLPDRDTVNDLLVHVISWANK
jgi:predicted nucleotidyltransferase